MGFVMNWGKGERCILKKSISRWLTMSVLSSTALLSGCGEHLPYPTKIQSVNAHRMKELSPAASPSVNTGLQPKVFGMRKFPYPYKAMLAISSDADHETLRKFNLIHEFINTHAWIPQIGHYGIGIPFADSVFMYNGSNTNKMIDYGNVRKPQELSWFKGTSGNSNESVIINQYMHDGWIDTLHSWGDFTNKNPNTTLFTPNLAKNAIHSLVSNGDRLTVWTDHGNQSNVDDFGSYGRDKFYTYQQGANPWSKYYHANMTLPYGVRFVWPDNASADFGRTSMIYPLHLPNHRTVWGFWRYTSMGIQKSTGNPEWDWTVGDLSKQITASNLASLEQHQEYSIVAQHLEALNTAFPLPPNAIDALWLLANQYDQKKLLVATTSHLLNYNVTQVYIQYHVTYSGGLAWIHLDKIVDPVDGSYVPTYTDVRGLTFYTSNPAKTVIEIGNTPIPSQDISYNPSDGSHPSIGVKWFAPDTKNYAIS